MIYNNLVEEQEPVGNHHLSWWKHCWSHVYADVDVVTMTTHYPSTTHLAISSSCLHTSQRTVAAGGGGKIRAVSWWDCVNTELKNVSFTQENIKEDHPSRNEGRWSQTHTFVAGTLTNNVDNKTLNSPFVSQRCPTSTPLFVVNPKFWWCWRSEGICSGCYQSRVHQVRGLRWSLGAAEQWQEHRSRLEPQLSTAASTWSRRSMVASQHTCRQRAAVGRWPSPSYSAVHVSSNASPSARTSCRWPAEELRVHHAALVLDGRVHRRWSRWCSGSGHQAPGGSCTWHRWNTRRKNQVSISWPVSTRTDALTLRWGLTFRW